MIKIVLPRSIIPPVASKSIPVPQRIVHARLASMKMKPAVTLTLYGPVRTLQLYPVAPHVNEYGPAGLAMIYLGIASADIPGVIIVSTEPPTILRIPVIALGIGEGGVLIISTNEGVMRSIELSPLIITSPAEIAACPPLDSKTLLVNLLETDPTLNSAP